jgi:hypothetical protein
MKRNLLLFWWPKKKRMLPLQASPKHQEHSLRTMARLRESDQLPAEARRYKDRIESDSARLPGKQCAKCDSRQFQRHQKRLRWFLPVVEGIVLPILCLLYRWRCVTCGTTFIHLPLLCVRFKRYLRGEIEARTGAYVETDPMSYRDVVKERGAAVVYDDPIADAAATEAEKEEEAVRGMAHSTVYRWIGGIAANREQWQPVVRLARQLQQGAGLRVIMISAAKYRSQARKRVLEAWYLLFRMNDGERQGALGIAHCRYPSSSGVRYLIIFNNDDLLSHIRFLPD